MKLFLIHAVYNRSEICYRDLINKLKIELLKEKLLNNPKSHIMGPFWLLIISPNAEKSVCFDNEAASTSLKQQVARSTRRSVAPVQWSLSVLCQKSKPWEVLISVTLCNVSNSGPAIALSYMDVLIAWISNDHSSLFYSLSYVWIDRPLMTSNDVTTFLL